jgi:osmotically-inducible protein OsmY
VEPDPEPIPSPQPPGVDAPLKDDASLSELLAAEGLGDVRVEIHEGQAVLRGVVEEPRLQDEAERLASALDGVDAVENEIGLPSA